MKKITLCLVLCILTLSVNLLAQIKVNSSGYVGINNTNPTYRLDLSGTLRMTYNSKTIVFTGSEFYGLTGYPSLGTSGSPWYQLYAAQAYFYSDPVILSDINLKTNIQDITSVTEKVGLLRPVTYNFISESNINKLQTYNTLQYGFIAQEVKEIFPDFVVTLEDGTLAIKYNALIPVLVQAVKEQKTEIDKLTKRISDLEKKFQ